MLFGFAGRAKVFALVTAKVSNTAAQVSGYTSPNSLVTFMESAAFIGTTVSDSTGYYAKLLSAEPAGIHIINIFSVDPAGNRTITVQQNIVVIEFQTAQVTLNLPPTLVLNAASFTSDQSLQISGYGKPGAGVHIDIQGPQNAAYTTTTGSDGKFVFSLRASVFQIGDYKLQASLINANNDFSSTALAFSITTQVTPPITPTPIPNQCTYPYLTICRFDPDTNGFLNFATDFRSFFLGYIGVYGQNSIPANAIYDINADGKIDESDLSIILFYTQQQNTLSKISGQTGTLTTPVTSFATSLNPQLEAGLLCICCLLPLILLSLLILLRRRKRNKRLANDRLPFLIMGLVILGVIAIVLLMTENTSSNSSLFNPSLNLITITQADSYRKGQQSSFDIQLQRLTRPINLVRAELSFDKNYIQISRIDTSSSFAAVEVANMFSNDTGSIQLIEGLANPGFLDTVGTVARVWFVAEQSGNTQVTFTTGTKLFANDGKGSSFNPNLGNTTINITN